MRRRRSWYIVLSLAFALHNTEEAVGAARLLAFMQSRGPSFLRDFYAGIEVVDLRISLVLLTIVGVLVATLATRKPTGAVSSFTMLVFAAVTGVNALAHVALTLALRAYMPGLITAIVITMPLVVVVLRRGWQERWVTQGAYWTVFPAAILVHGPILAGFVLGSVGLARMVSRAFA